MLTCDFCRHHVDQSKDSNFKAGSSCIRISCPGHYQADATNVKTTKTTSDKPWLQCNKCGRYAPKMKDDKSFNAGMCCVVHGCDGDYVDMEAKPITPPVPTETILTIGGAQTSKLDGRFDLLPFEGLLAAARRFQMGAEKYAPWQWAGATDEAFAKDRVNHLVRHTALFAQFQRTEDLEAILANAMMLAHYQAVNGWLKEKETANG